MKNIFEPLKPYWKHIVAVLTIIVTIAGGYNDIKQAATDAWTFFFPMPTLVMSLSPNQVNAGERFQLNYETPKTGYLSLWNKDASKQRVKKLLPVEGMGTFTLSKHNHIASLKLTATGGNGTDQYILLWTPKNQTEHLSHREYTSYEAFEAELDALEKRGNVLKVVKDLPIFVP